MSQTIAIQVNADNIDSGAIETFVGSDNYEYVAPGHVRVFGEDAKTPEWIFYDGTNLKISRSKTLKELYYEVKE